MTIPWYKKRAELFKLKEKERFLEFLNTFKNEKNIEKYINSLISFKENELDKIEILEI